MAKAIIDHTANKYCNSTDLTNEASVEASLCARLLKDLGYSDTAIQTKQSIQSLQVGKGRKRGHPFKPDFVLLSKGRPVWLGDAKGVTEQVDDYSYQCSNYSLQINQKHDDNPVRFYMLTNGLLTRIYPWDKDEAVLSLRFSDFKDGNTKYETLKKLLSANELLHPIVTNHMVGHVLKKPVYGCY